MPIGPNRSGSSASMMQYTYLPRLVIPGSDRGATIGSETARWTLGEAAFAGAGLAAAAFPFPLRRAAFNPAPFAFLAARRGSGALTLCPRPPVRRELPDGVGIFPAPAGLPCTRRRLLVEHLADFLHQIFGETRLGDERVAAGLSRAVG